MRTLPCERLAELRLVGGRPLAAASGLVCAHGLVHVVADDALQLGVFEAADRPGRSWPLLPGRLPVEASARKQAKPDFELLLRWQGGLLAMGSGALPQREQAVWLAANQPPRAFSLAPLYARLRQAIGPLNLEGGLRRGRELWLLQRGNAGASGNGLLRLPAPVLEALRRGEPLPPVRPRWQPMALGTLDGVALGFTDACALDAEHWLFSAAAEDTPDAIRDGRCLGSVLGLADAQGRLLRRWRLPAGLKIEGIDAQRWPDGSVSVAMVSDADDPARPAQLLRARFRAP
jgi:hypothetical protein